MFPYTHRIIPEVLELLGIGMIDSVPLKTWMFPNIVLVWLVGYEKSTGQVSLKAINRTYPLHL